MKQFVRNWWNTLRYEPDDPRHRAGGEIKIAVVGGGTGLANLLRGLKQYSHNISAIVTVTDAGGSTGILRGEFDIIAPGDIRQCLSALADNERLITELFDYRFSKDKRVFGGHTLGNIWLTALASHYDSFEKAIEVTSEIFKMAGKVLPSTLENIDLIIEYVDGTKKEGEFHLDEIIKRVKEISLNKKGVKAYDKAVAVLGEADLIVIGPGSLYGSIIPNLLVSGIRDAITKNKKAVKVYIANCSTERTQTRGYTVADHIQVLKKYGGGRIFDYCLVNNRVLSTSKDEKALGKVNNITTDEKEISGCMIICDDVISESNPLYHDSEKLAKSLVDLYRTTKGKK